MKLLVILAFICVADLATPFPINGNVDEGETTIDLKSPTITKAGKRETQSSSSSQSSEKMTNTKNHNEKEEINRTILPPGIRVDSGFGGYRGYHGLQKLYKSPATIENIGTYGTYTGRLERVTPLGGNEHSDGFPTTFYGLSL